MKLPKDIGGEDLTHLLSQYGYRISRQTGSHLRLSSSIKGGEHHLSIPNHKPLKVGTLSGVLSDVAGYLGIDKQDLLASLFGK
ncbi:MAG: type II toxin-antitoxin system HicA family toxin [Candidatus Bipolaricaulota bacterium]